MLSSLPSLVSPPLSNPPHFATNLFPRFMNFGLVLFIHLSLMSIGACGVTGECMTEDSPLPESVSSK